MARKDAGLKRGSAGMNGTADAQMAALRQEYDRLRQTADLTQATDTVWRLSRDAGGFDARVTALRQGGYLFTKGLANDARDLRDRWRTIEAEFDRALRDARYDVEHSLDRVDRAMRRAASSLRGPRSNPSLAACRRSSGAWH